MVILAVAVVLSVLAYAVSLRVLFGATPVLRAHELPAPPLPSICVIVPARDEERNIVACIEAVLAQDYPNLEVVAVDDGSSDATPELLAVIAARDPRLRVIQGAELPRGWAGKNHAVHQGVRAARGSWLLFLDADVRLEPAAVSAAYAWARDHGVGLLSLWPRQELVGRAERLVQSVALGMYYFGDLYHRLRRPWSLSAGRANGQFMLCSRASYEAVGGHEAVRQSVIEDYELSLSFRRHGLSTATVNGRDLAVIRMYTSLEEVWQGWSKNTFVGMRHGYAETLGASLMVAMICIGPAAVTIAALVGHAGPDAAPLLVLAAISWLLLATAHRLLRPAAALPAGYVLAYPIGGTVLIGILINSAYRHTVGGGVRWKGRSYAARGGRPRP